MSELITVSSSSSPGRLNVVFVHGLGGNGRTTWLNESGQYFPEWVGEDIEGVKVYSVDYDASPSKWMSNVMPLYDRATEMLEVLRVNKIFDLPTIFVTHSMGGIVVKKMLQLVETTKRPEWEMIASCVEGVVFLSTPHAGSYAATFLKNLGRVLGSRPTEFAEVLESNSAQLRELSTWFQAFSYERKFRCRVYFEKHDTLKVRVVSESSADPGLPWAIVSPVEANHLEISKPQKGKLVHLGVCDFIQGIVNSLPPVGRPKRSIEEARSLLSDDNKAIVGILDDNPELQLSAIDVLISDRFPLVMSVGNEGHLVPNPAWDSSHLDLRDRELPITNCLRGHMFLSVVHPPKMHPHLKCYFAERWGANLIPFFKHPMGSSNYQKDVIEHGRNHYQGEVHPTGKFLVSVKRNEQLKRELWLYCFELYSLVLPRNYKSDDDHVWLNLERLTDIKFPEANINGDIVRALRGHFGTGFHGIERSRVDWTELKLGDT